MLEPSMTTPRLTPDLLSHLIDEFVDDGKRAVDFLRTAEALTLMPDETLPGHSELIAYALREAMKAIPASQRTGGGGEWSTRSRAVVEAKKRFQLAQGLPGEEAESALNDLMQKIDEMEITHKQERIHQKRLIAVIINRTGAVPVSGGTQPVEAYQGLLDRLDKAVHGTMTMAEARRIWEECLAILHQLFLPPGIRFAALDNLASVQNPDEADRIELIGLVSSPQHLKYFLQRIQDSTWLDLLFDSSLLAPPRDYGGWPILAAVEYLHLHHGEALTSVLERIFDRYGENERSAWYIARTALDLGEQGYNLLLRSLNRHNKSRPLSSFAISAAEKSEPSSDFVQKVADRVLNSNSWEELSPHTLKLAEVYWRGLTAENCEARIKLLSYKLKSVPGNDRELRLFEYDQGHLGESFKGVTREEHFGIVLSILVQCLRRAVSMCDAERLLNSSLPLKGVLKSRVRVWILANAREAQFTTMIAEISESISSRRPTLDDADLIDKITRECEAELFEASWRESLGGPPNLASLGNSLAQSSVPTDWRRAYQWSAVLPNNVWRDWENSVSVMAGAYGQPSRDQLRPWPNVQVSFSQSPIEASELADLPPEEVAQKIAAWQPENDKRNVSARELGRTLEELVKNNCTAWVQSPIAVASKLRHPTYINHYLMALAKSDSLAAAQGGALVDLIELTRTHPWPVIALGQDTFDFDETWRPVELAGVDLIKSLAEGDAGYEGRNDFVWSVLTLEVTDREEGSGGSESDHLAAAINRPCTQALEAMLSFLAFERRQGLAVRPEFYQILEEVLRLVGEDGAQHRAILGPRFGFLQHLTGDWFDEHHVLIFGDSAPAGMGQLTVDLALRWGQPRQWLLESYKQCVQDAVARNVENSMPHYVIGFLRGLKGYSVRNTIDFFGKLGKISEVGESIGRLLRGDPNLDDSLVASAIAFWREVIKLQSVESLNGFGWMAEVTAIDDETWSRLTVDTLTVTNGKIDWSHEVAERAAAQEQSRETLMILDLLVRGLQNEWDRRDVGKTAKRALLNANCLQETIEFRRLHTTLLERGILD